MKRLIYGFALLLVVASCGPTIYLAPGFEQAKAKHRKVAILPFDVLITAKKLPKGVTQEMVVEQQKNTGYSIQSNAYTYLLRQMSKNKYTVDFQDIDQTNAVLKRANLSYDDLKAKSKEELCSLLGVDAVISGKIIMARPMSEGAALAVGALFGVWGNTDKVDASLTIHDRDSSKLLWKYDYMASGSVGSSSEQLARALMRNASKRFPYTAS